MQPHGRIVSLAGDPKRYARVGGGDLPEPGAPELGSNNVEPVERTDA